MVNPQARPRAGRSWRGPRLGRPAVRGLIAALVIVFVGMGLYQLLVANPRLDAVEYELRVSGDSVVARIVVGDDGRSDWWAISSDDAPILSLSGAPENQSATLSAWIGLEPDGDGAVESTFDASVISAGLDLGPKDCHEIQNELLAGGLDRLLGLGSAITQVCDRAVGAAADPGSSILVVARRIQRNP